MTTRVIVLFNLKPGITREDYEAFAIERDIPGVNSLKAVEKFEVYRSTGLFRTGDPAPYQYIEVLDIADMAGFSEEASAQRMKDIAATFRSFADPIFIETEKLG